MKIALIGYGKMGQAIEKNALQKGHQIVLKINIENTGDFTTSAIRQADVAIEFTGPQSAADNIRKCLDAGVPVVSGSTGWLSRFAEISQYCQEKEGALVYASNFSIGVNLFFELNRYFSALMARWPQYDVMVEEIHHTQKKDAPSGTAITLAEDLLENIPRKNRWVNQDTDDPEELAIISQRIDATPGTHKIRYHSPIDDLEIIHTAHNREGFASGAVLAAEFITGKKGVFGMKEVLGL